MNSTINRVLELESLYASLEDCEVSLRIEAPLKEMEEAAIYLNNCHLAHPFEDNHLQDCYRFLFVSERNSKLKITVSSKEKFRFNKEIIEI